MIESKKRSVRKMKTLTALLIESKYPYNDSDAGVMERAVCSCIYNSDNPICRCLSCEILFDAFPDISYSERGRTCYQGPADPTVLCMLACHPRSKIRGTVVEIEIEPTELATVFQDAFLAYLAAFRNRSETRIRLAGDRRFGALVDNNTGELMDSRSPIYQEFIKFKS